MGVHVENRIERIYTDRECFYVRLVSPQFTPKDGYFKVELTHPNYNALYSLAMYAAANRMKIHVRTEQDITPTEHGIVSYMHMEWL